MFFALGAGRAASKGESVGADMGLRVQRLVARANPLAQEDPEIEWKNSTPVIERTPPGFSAVFLIEFIDDV
jgi:hypothetical protein